MPLPLSAHPLKLPRRIRKSCGPLFLIISESERGQTRGKRVLFFEVFFDEREGVFYVCGIARSMREAPFSHKPAFASANRLDSAEAWKTMLRQGAELHSGVESRQRRHLPLRRRRHIIIIIIIFFSLDGSASASCAVRPCGEEVVKKGLLLGERQLWHGDVEDQPVLRQTLQAVEDNHRTAR